MSYCEGCNTQYADTGCGQDQEHANCPQSCGLCGEPITGRDSGCQGHRMAEVVAHADRLRSRA